MSAYWKQTDNRPSRFSALDDVLIILKKYNSFQWRSGCLTKRRILDLFLQILNEAEREIANCLRTYLPAVFAV